MRREKERKGLEGAEKCERRAREERELGAGARERGSEKERKFGWVSVAVDNR
jgi:hypothetical protein